MAFELNRIPLSGLEVHSLNWAGAELVDLAGGGQRFGIDGPIATNTVIFGYRFDRATVSPSGNFAVLYEALGTKALILRITPKIQEVREIDRSYYCADVHEYPVAICGLPNGREAVIHCPQHYNELQVDDLETGARFSTRPEGGAADFFHSRLAVDASGRWLISAGWIWHPFDEVSRFDLQACRSDPAVLDKLTHPVSIPSAEVNHAAFVPGTTLVLLSSNPGSDDFGEDEDTKAARLRAGTLALWDVATGAFNSAGKLAEPTGRIMPLGDDLAVCFHQHPRLIRISTGETLHRWSDIDCGQYPGAVTHHVPKPPPLALDAAGRRFAVAQGSEIVVVAGIEE